MHTWIFKGNLGKDPELHVTSDGTAYTRFNVAVNRSYKNRAGQPVKETEWIPVVTWSTLAENCEKYLRKGSPVLVRGRLTSRKYPHREHPDVMMTYYECNADEVEFLSSGSGYAPTSDDVPGEPWDVPGEAVASGK